MASSGVWENIILSKTPTFGCLGKYNIFPYPHTPSKVGVLESIIFSHIPDEAMSVGLAKAYFPSKKLSFLIENQTE